MKRNATRSTAAARRPRRPAAGTRAPVMAQLYRQAETHLRKQRRQQRSKTGAVPPVAGPLRLLHELQVHQVELEMQNSELQQTRDELEAALANYTDLYDFAPAGYFTLTEPGVIRQVNLTGAALVGQERAELVGRSFGQWVAAAQRSDFQSFLKKVFAGETKATRDFEILRPDQPSRIVSLEARRLLHSQECRVAMTDITERKRAEEAVRLSEVRYRRLFEEAHDGVLILDPGTGKITDANPVMARLLGCPPAQLAGKALFEIGLLKDAAACRELFQKLKRKPEVRYEDLPFESRAGRHLEFEVVASRYQENHQAVVQCNLRDITERKQAERARRRLALLTASNRQLKREIIRRQAVEATLKQSEQRQARLLAQSQHLQEQLRQLSRQVLQAQEEERKRISRELHDVIAQTLTGINLQLAALKREAVISPRGLGRKISRTQRLVENSVNLVHEFARELRPAVLDDLGLIPALHSFLKSFTARTGIHTRLNAAAGVEKLDPLRRTVLFRVAQEALTNVARHARASRVEVDIESRPHRIGMSITDNGKAFSVAGVLHANGNKRLGLIGMRERLEMVGGRFEIESAPGTGTTVSAQIPLGRRRAAKKH